MGLLAGPDRSPKTSPCSVHPHPPRRLLGPCVVDLAHHAAHVHRSGPAIAGFFANLTPLFAALLSAAFLGELPRLYHALAFVLIVGGIVVSTRQ